MVPEGVVVRRRWERRARLPSPTLARCDGPISVLRDLLLSFGRDLAMPDRSPARSAL